MVAREIAASRLAAAEWLSRRETQDLMAMLGGHEGRTRAVGGVVRDTILSRAWVGDIDLATELRPDEVAARVTDAGGTVYPTGVEHGTVTVKLGDLVAEVTTLREDVLTDGRRATVRFGTDWTRDAERRDFTLNALYAGIDGTLFDPLDAFEDALEGRVRFIGDPNMRIAEDRLRVFRFFRFSASHGGQRFDQIGLDACRLAADRLGRLSAERVGAEMKRMLALPKVALTLQTMVLAGILALSPETMRLLTSYELRAQPPTLAGRLAIIVAATGSQAVRKQWRLSNAEVATAEAIGAAADLLANGAVNEAAYRYPGGIVDALVLGAIIGHWDDDRLAAIRQSVGALAIPRFPISGRDLEARGLTRGRALGRERDRLEHAWIDSGFTLGRAELLSMIGEG